LGKYTLNQFLPIVNAQSATFSITWQLDYLNTIGLGKVLIVPVHRVARDQKLPYVSAQIPLLSYRIDLVNGGFGAAGLYLCSLWVWRVPHPLSNS